MAKEQKTKDQKTQTAAPQSGKKAKSGDDVKVVEEKIPARLKEKYSKEIVPKLKEQFNYKSIMQVPKIEKIVLNMGVGQAVQDAKILEEAVKDLETITGQKFLLELLRKQFPISNYAKE